MPETLSSGSEHQSSGRTIPFVLGIIVGVVLTVIVGGAVMFTGRSSTPEPVTADQAQSALEGLGLSECTSQPAPTEGKAFTATNVICQRPDVDESKVSMAVVSKNFEAARADLCIEAVGPTFETIQIVSDNVSVIGIGGKGVLGWSDDPTVQQVAASVGAQVLTIPQFCAGPA